MKRPNFFAFEQALYGAVDSLHDYPKEAHSFEVEMIDMGSDSLSVAML